MTSTHSVLIRFENPESGDERAAIRAVNAAAFGGFDEADLVDKLRTDAHALISLVAVLERRIVGHIMFSRMWIRTLSGLISAVALAPVAVLPEHQRKGIGGLLIQHGLAKESLWLLDTPVIIQGSASRPIKPSCSKVPFHQTHSWRWSLAQVLLMESGDR